MNKLLTIVVPVYKVEEYINKFDMFISGTNKHEQFEVKIKTYTDKEKWVSVNINKIVNAINRAMIHVDGCLYETETAEEIADIIASEGKTMSVEHIQDRVEEELKKLFKDIRKKEMNKLKS